MMNSNFHDEKIDMHPRSWISNYRQLSLWYLLKMGMFYSTLGLVIAFLIIAIELIVLDYEEPVIQISFIQALVAGPVEETLFFGIPYSATGNPYFVMITGFIWAAVHIFNAQLVDENKFSYATAGAAVPHIFFSLRAWRSGRGWFTIAYHSGWNAMIFGIAVGIGEIPFRLIDDNFPELDFTIIALSVILMAITYPLYKWRIKREKRKAEKF